MERSVTKTSLTALPADLRKLIEETEDSMETLYRTIDERVPRKAKPATRSGAKKRVTHREAPRRAYSTEGDASSSYYSSESEGEAYKRAGDGAVRHSRVQREVPHRKSAHRNTHRRAASPSTSSAHTETTPDALVHSGAKQHDSRAARFGRTRSDGAPRAYRHVTYPEDAEEETTSTYSEPAHAVSSRLQHTKKPTGTTAPVDWNQNATSPSLEASGRQASARARAPYAGARNNDGLCESTLPNQSYNNNTNVSIMNQSTGFANRSAAHTESATTTPTKMMTQFGLRWDVKYRQILSTIAESPVSKRASSAAVSPQRERALEGAPPAPVTPTVTTPQYAVEPSRPGVSSVPTKQISRDDEAQPSSAPLTLAPQLDLTAVAAQHDALQGAVYAKEKELLEMERAHVQQVAALREDIAKARREGAEEAKEQLATSAALKESILHAALETERQRTAEMAERAQEAEKALREARRRLDEQETNALLQNRTQALRDQELETLRQRCEGLDTQLRHASEERREMEQSARRTQQDGEALSAQLEAATRARDALESRLAEQEESAKTALKQLEDEFENATTRYQALLDEATRRVEYLEKVQRKYKSLKDAHHRVTETSEETTTSLRRQLTERDALVETLRKELRAVQEESVQHQALMKAKEDASEEKQRSLQRQLELKGASSSEQVKTLQQHLETANHTIELLRTQVDSLKEEINDEQAQTQQVSMRMAEMELRLKEELVQEQRDAAAAKSRHAEAIAALKQQLKEKNGKLEALAASSMEPLQRLREQLESERGKRAHLEEQLARLKKRAKEAEEATLRELRREQLRQSTEAAALLTATPNTARPSPLSAAGGGSGSVLNSAHRPSPSQTYSSVPPWALLSARQSRHDGPPSSRSPHGSRLASANARSDAPSSVDEHVKPYRSGEPAGRGRAGSAEDRPVREGSPPQVQTTAIVEQLSPPPAHGSYEETTAVFPASVPPTLRVWQDERQQRQPPPPSRLARPRPADSEAYEEPEDPAAPPFRRVGAGGASLTGPAHAPPRFGEECTHQNRSTANDDGGAGEGAVPRSGDGATGNTSFTPPATVGSLSGISRSSPCNSTSRLDEDASVALCGDAAGGMPQPAQRSRTASPHGGPLTAGHLVSPRAQEGVITSRKATNGGERGDADAVVSDQHEQRMREFHASAADVMRRISGSRDAFMSRCAQVIQRSSALGTGSALEADFEKEEEP